MTPALNIGITGASGCIGWNVRCLAEAQGGYDVRTANRETYADEQALEQFVDGCDGIVHCAGANRGVEADIEAANRSLAQRLVDACLRAGSTPHVVYMNSTHHVADTPYGRSKRQAAEILERWSEIKGARFTNLIVPHVFGEGSRPYYNSVVATLCHQLANGETPTVNGDGVVELIHAQEVAEVALAALSHGKDGEQRLLGATMSVPSVFQRLQRLHERYASGTLPATADGVDHALFNTLRSFLYPAHYPVPLTLHSDARGALFEAVKSDGGGQTFLSTTKPGITRGDHYHLSKIERFLVVEGEGVIRIRRMFDAVIREFWVTGDEPVYVDIPTMHTHNITNVGTAPMVTLFWSNALYDPENPDTVSHAV